MNDLIRGIHARIKRQSRGIFNPGFFVILTLVAFFDR
jgi:hypothetical protein